MPTIVELRSAISKHKDKNCPAFSKLKKAQLLALVKQLGIDVQEVKAPAKKTPKSPPTKKTPKSPPTKKAEDWKEQAFKFNDIDYDPEFNDKEFYYVKITRTFPPTAIEKKTLIDGHINQEQFAPLYEKAHKGKLSESLIKELRSKIRKDPDPILKDILEVNTKVKKKMKKKAPTKKTPAKKAPAKK